MFFLRHKEDPVAFYIYEDKTYTIGRKQCDFLIENDNSISRQHATITLKKGQVIITDLKAKYKTFINSEALAEEEYRTLEKSDTIHFGILNSIYILEEIRINVVCSGLYNREKKKLTEYVQSLNGKLYLNWSVECTYLTLQEIVLTIKLLCALTEGQNIVTVKYWEDFIKNVRNNIPPPCVDDYKPMSAETILSKNISFKYNPLRKTLFSNKMFVFHSAKEKNNMEQLINLTGGMCISWNEKLLKPEDMHSTKPEYIMIQNETQTEISDAYNNMVNYISQIDKRLIPQQEIALAILSCCCKQNCNPNFNRNKTLIQPKTDVVKTPDILVAQTPSQSQVFSLEDLKPFAIIPQTAEEDIFADKEGPVTSTQIEASPSSSFLIANISGIKREGELLEKLDNKRSKTIEIDKSKTDEKHPIDHIKLTQTESQQPEISSAISNLEVAHTSRNITKKCTLEFKTLTPSRKRNNDDAPQSNRPLKKPNPFSTLGKRKFVPLSISLENKQDKIDSNDNIKTNEVKKKCVPIQNPISEITVVDQQLEHSFPWISKSNIKIDSHLQQESNESSDIIDAMSNYINSFRDCIIIKILPMVVRKPLENVSTQNVSIGTKNFKKFKKVKPLNPQTTIIPNTAYKIYRCGEGFV